MAKNTLDSLVTELGLVLAPLQSGFADPQQVEILINALGWDLPPGVNDIGLMTIDVQTFIEKLLAVVGATPEEQEDDVLMMGRYAELLVAAGDLIRAITTAMGAISSLPGVSADYINKTKIHEHLMTRLLDFLVIKYFQNYQYITFTVLQILGIFELEHYDADPAIYQVEHVRNKVFYDRIGTIFSDIGSLPATVYGWGSANFDIESLLLRITLLLQAFGAEVRLSNMRRKLEEQLLGHPVPEADTDPMPQVFISLLKGIGDDPLDVGLSAFGVRPSSPGATDGGVGMAPFASGTTDLVLPLASRLSFEIKSSVDIQGGVVLLMRPGAPISVKSDLLGAGSGSTVASGNIVLLLRYVADSASPIRILSVPGGSRLEVRELYVGAGGGLVDSNSFDAFLEAGLKGGQFVLTADESDSFIAKLLPAGSTQIGFDLTGGWSRKQGLYFRGSSTLEIKLPTHIQVGPVNIEALYLALKLGTDGEIAVELSSAFTGSQGPLSAAVERLGLLAQIGFPSGGGNLGPMDLGFKFKPPNGVGLSIDTGVVKGGGYLYFDFDREEYAGALELTFAEFLSLKAIGLITTRMPDGSKGFSLLVIITAEFPSGIQLGMGFVLLGVGGLLGLNRTMLLQPLMEGVRTGAVNRIMFPQNVIENAPQIISDLRTIFPPYEGKFLIGPMAKLGYGSPPIITLSLGIVIEIPGNIAILGVLKLELPQKKAETQGEDETVVLLQVSFAGAIEFDKKRAYLFASLFESRILTMPIDGDMGVLVAWGDNANFVLSVGGFHPQFNPPPLPFPNPNRIALTILNRPNARIQVMGYFAVTSNTVQFGARAELFFGFSEFRVTGHITFDALMRFSPFYFIIQISSSVSLEVFGVGLFSIRLRFSLEGPSPWRAKGSGSLSLLFFDFEADFDVTWGEARDTTLPPIEVMPLLKTEFDKLENWTAGLPSASNLLVSLRQLEGNTSDPLLHPVGSLRISQRAVPLDLTIDKVGNQKVKDANKFWIEVTSDGLEKKGDSTEGFAMAQFQEMDDNRKLTRPAFEPQHSGVEISVMGAQYDSSRMVKRVVRHELIIVDTNFKRYAERFVVFWKGLFMHFLEGSAAANSALSAKRKKQLQPFAEKISIQPDNYAVAFSTDNKAVSDEAKTFTSEALAREYLQAQIAADPNQVGKLHVIPQTELNEAV